MKTSAKIILTAAFISTLGLGGLARSAQAKQPQVVVMSQHFSSVQVTEASDKDREVNDATVASEKNKQLQIKASSSSDSPTQVLDANNGNYGTSSTQKLMITPSVTSRPETPKSLPLIDPNPPAEVPSPSLLNFGV